MNLSKIALGASAISVASYFALSLDRQKLGAAQKEYELVHVQVVFRHGARTPLGVPSYLPRLQYDKKVLMKHAPETYIPYNVVPLGDLNMPDSPFERAYRHRGILEGGCLPGQLTNLGADQMYQLGLFLKTRYVNGMFLTPSYSSLVEEIYTRSTNIERTIMSARCVLAGLFSGKSGNDTLDIHVAPPNEEIMYPNYYTCGYLKNLTRWAWDHPEKIPGIKQIDDLIRKSLDVAPDENVNLVGLRDNLAVEEAHKMPSVKMAKEVLQKVEDGAWAIMHTAFVGEEAVRKESLRLAIGPFVDILLQNMEEKCNEKDKQGVKMHLYSGHDTTLIPLLSALDIKNSSWPPYASNVIFELVRKNNAVGAEPKYYVRLFYNGEVQRFGDSKSSLCSLEEFKNSLAHIRISFNEYRQKCQHTTD